METVFGSLQSTSFSLSNLLLYPVQSKFTSSRVSFASYHPYPNQNLHRRNPSLSSRTRELAKLGTMSLAAVQAYDSASESMDALNEAELIVRDIINSPSLDAACRKIDSLAEKNQLDFALVLMITKAWSVVMKSNMTEDEVKAAVRHLHATARGNLQKLMPNEIRILKYLITIEDPEQRICGLKDAFTPGEELEGQDVDSLYTTPEKLYTSIRTIVGQEGTPIREARELMDPEVIQRLEELKKLIQDQFM